MKLLVTGGAGFIGKALLREVRQRGWRATIVGRRTRPADGEDNPSERWLQADLSVREDVARIGEEEFEAVVHLAVDVGGPQGFARSLDMTTNLLASLPTDRMVRLVAVSSMAVYDLSRLSDHARVDEDAPLLRLEAGEYSRSRPRTYAAMKRLQERLFERHRAENGGELITLRPGLVYDQCGLPGAHAGVFCGPLGVLCGHDGLVPVIRADSLARAICDAIAAAQLPDRPLNLIDDDLPRQKLYLQALQRKQRRLLLTLPWPFWRSLAGAAWRMFAAAGQEERAANFMRPEAMSLRFKPLCYSNEQAKAALGWRANCAFTP